MVERIKLENFQSHKNTEIELNPGVNSIVGSSDGGKTAILRALYWVVNNRPTGSMFVSHWTKNEKGKQIKKTSVSVEFSGNSITRLRFDKKNIYQASNGAGKKPKEFEALRSDVPEEIAKIHNFQEVNIQRQMDAPFLLSASAGEVARFFNRIIKLDVIDRILSLAESKKRELKRNIEALAGKEIQTEESIAKFKGLDKIEKAIEKADKYLTRKESKEIKVKDLQSLSEKYLKESNNLKSHSTFISNIEPKFDDLKVTISTLETAETSVNNLNSSLINYKTITKFINSLPNLEEIELKCGKYQRYKDRIAKKKESLMAIKKSLSDTSTYLMAIDYAKKGIKEAQGEMPDICPLCNNPFPKRSNK